MGFTEICVIVIVLGVVLSSSIYVVDADDASVVQILEKNGLPAGLLPASVKSYEMEDNGKFSVELAGACYTKIQEEVYYKKRITGELSYGKIQNLVGISVHEFWLWLSVTGIYIDDPLSGWIYFQVGVVSKRLPLDLFQKAPSCNSLREEEPLGMLFSDWLAKALKGELEISTPRKLLQ